MPSPKHPTFISSGPSAAEPLFQGLGLTGYTNPLRQTHLAGEKLFVDWAGDTMPVFDHYAVTDRVIQFGEREELPVPELGDDPPRRQ